MNKLIFTKVHIVLEILSCVLILAGFIVAVIAMASGEEFPVHYDLSDNATGNGSAATLFIMPAIMFFTNLIMSASIHIIKPGAWNLPFDIRPGREIPVLRAMTMMIAVMELLFGIFTFVFTIAIYQKNGKVLMPLTFLFLAALFADIIIMYVFAYRCNKK